MHDSCQTSSSACEGIQAQASELAAEEASWAAEQEALQLESRLLHGLADRLQAQAAATPIFTAHIQVSVSCKFYGKCAGIWIICMMIMSWPYP